MGEMWYSYCPRPADSKCGVVQRTIDTVKPTHLKENDLSLFDSSNKDYCFYEIKINS